MKLKIKVIIKDGNEPRELWKEYFKDLYIGMIKIHQKGGIEML